jgi:predicted small lipoprotein YifL
MKRLAAILALGLAVFFVPACGRKGPLQPPAAREPKPAESLTAFQRGGSIILEWTNPAKYLDGRPLAAAGSTSELWTLESGPEAKTRPQALKEFETRARPVRRITSREARPVPAGVSGAVTFAYPLAGSLTGHRTLAFSVRLLDARGRPSKLCPPVLVETRVCPLPPVIRDVRVFADFIEISWTPPAANIDGSSPPAVTGYTVYRSEGGGEPEKLAPSPASGPSFEDRRFQFGTPYAYFVRALASGGDSGLESDDSAVRTVVPRDVFPPNAPAGLVAISGPEVISLSWDPVRAGDLAGYRVWKKEEGQPEFAPLAQGLLPGTAFTDPAVQKGKSYVYAVSAEDTNGNESPKTETGPISLKGSRT